MNHGSHASAARGRIARALIVCCALVAAAQGADAGRTVRAGNLIYAAGSKTSICFSDRFLTTVHTDGGIPTEKRMRAVRLDQREELMAHPFVVMTGKGSFALPENERALLKEYLDGGGFLLASAGCSDEQWSTSLRTELTAVFGAESIAAVPMSHPVFHTLFDLADAPLKGGGSAAFAGVMRDGRLAALISKEGLNDTEHTQGCCCCGGNEVKNAEEVVANALVYALVE